MRLQGRSGNAASHEMDTPHIHSTVGLQSPEIHTRNPPYIHGFPYYPNRVSFLKVVQPPVKPIKAKYGDLLHP